jgi:hypothetical protein
MGMSLRNGLSSPLHDRYLEPSEALDYEIIVLANKGHLLLMRRLLRRAREQINRVALDARINDRPIDVVGESLIMDIDNALAVEPLYEPV